MFSFSNPSPKFSSSRTLVKTAFFSFRNFSASATAALSVGIVERERDDGQALAGRYFSMHLDHVREVFLAGAAGRRPGIDDGVLDLLVAASRVLELLPVEPLQLHVGCPDRLSSDTALPIPTRAAATTKATENSPAG